MTGCRLNRTLTDRARPWSKVIFCLHNSWTDARLEKDYFFETKRWKLLIRVQFHREDQWQHFRSRAKSACAANRKLCIQVHTYVFTNIHLPSVILFNQLLNRCSGSFQTEALNLLWIRYEFTLSCGSLTCKSTCSDHAVTLHPHTYSPTRKNARDVMEQKEGSSVDFLHHVRLTRQNGEELSQLYDQHFTSWFLISEKLLFALPICEPSAFSVSWSAGSVPTELWEEFWTQDT